MPDLTQLNELAYLERDCPDYHHMLGHEEHDKECSNPKCKDGKVFVFGEMVRVKCQACNGTKWKRYGRRGQHCPDCSGRGTIASTDGIVWADAAASLGFPFNMRKEGDTWFAWYEDMYDKRGEAPDLLAAVLAAIEQTPQVREAIEKAVANDGS